ncbi:hypothetical protein N177_2652 [Lutibaculum baratangense AMV1]|uniref:Uncharacterized protein n=1 Tax=Lutibaculum baratangense AMV1 TaxID=631454 RepID=V4TD23_9HYPH|nr:hypothetical protein N177_2652 [Lutibaculum baratangense AMV1]
MTIRGIPNDLAFRGLRLAPADEMTKSDPTTGEATGLFAGKTNDMGGSACEFS